VTVVKPPDTRKRERKVRPPVAAQARPGHTGWVWPTLRTTISQEPSAHHQAIDISWPGILNSPVFAPTASTVEAIRYEPGSYGLNVRLRTTEGYSIILGHLQASAAGLTPGQNVEAGQVVGLVGSTGHSTGPHLHYEVREPGHEVDRFLPGGYSAGVGAVNPQQFYGASAPIVTTDRVTPTTQTFTFAPAALPSVTLPGGTPSAVTANQPGEAQRPLVSSAAAAYLRAFTAVTGVPVGTAAERGVAEKASAEGDIRVAHTPVGDVTIPRPGTTFVKYALVAIGLLMVFIGIIIIARTGRGIAKGREETKEVIKAVVPAAVASSVGGE
jgi:hypothetical protein